jgi:hypothetical protein
MDWNEDEDEHDKLMQEIEKLERHIIQMEAETREVIKTREVLMRVQRTLRFNHDDGYQPLPHN